MAVGGTKVNPSKFEKSQIPLYLYLLPLAVVMGAPIVYIVCHAFKPMDELFAFPPKFIVSIRPRSTSRTFSNRLQVRLCPSPAMCSTPWW